MNFVCCQFSECIVSNKGILLWRKEAETREVGSTHRQEISLGIIGCSCTREAPLVPRQHPSSVARRQVKKKKIFHHILSKKKKKMSCDFIRGLSCVLNSIHAASQEISGLIPLVLVSLYFNVIFRDLLAIYSQKQDSDCC